MKRFTSWARYAALGTTALTSMGSALAQELDISGISDEIVVRGARIPDEKRATSEISSILDEASFQRTGDSDIGDALRRVTGLSLSQGKFVIVRGLNERYSSVTLDGSPLPSPEPLRRVIPLDIIPTSILSGSLVQKTYSPQYSAEFGGGLVELRTKSVPDEAYFKIGGNIGMDLATTGKNGFTYDGGERDWTGFDDGTRNIPQPLADAFFGRNGVNFNPADQNLIDASIDADKTTVIVENTIPPNWGVDLAFGAATDVSSSIRLGANFALGFSHDWQTREGRREQGFTTSGAAAPSEAFNIVNGTQFPLTAQSFDFTGTTQTIAANGVASIGLELGDDHEISWTSLMLRSTVKDARIATGVRGEESSIELQQENMEFFERQVWQTQLRGDHVLPALSDLTIAWRGAYGEAFRDAPYQRQFRRYRSAADEDFGLLFNEIGSLDNDSVLLTFSDVEDENIDAGVDFTLPLTIGGGALDLKAGYAYTDKKRDTLVREFRYDQGPLGLPSIVNDARNDVLLSDGVAGSDAFDIQFVANPIALDNALSALKVHAAYAGVDLEANEYFRFAVGGRYEDGEQTTEAFSTAFPTSSLSSTVIQEDYFLPAVTVTWNPTGDLQVRAGFSQTITRPQFRELTPATFLDDETDQLVIGNPFLVNSELTNYDARAEYYFSRGQFITLGGFYKDITNPIEVTSTQIGGADAQTFVNAPSAKLYGFEVEFEKNFPLGGRWSSKDLVFKTNYTWSKSKVSADGDVTTAVVNSQSGAVANVSPAAGFIVDGRSLQGQSSHLFNLQLGYEDVELNSRATLLINWASRRIRQTENIITGAPAVVEHPPITLDFVWSRGLETFGGQWEIGFKVKNILGDDYEALQSFADGTEAKFDTYRLGREISFNISKEF
ncbi:MAG: TonB-dependent receptor [Parvularculaceae bacterium]